MSPVPDIIDVWLAEGRAGVDRLASLPANAPHLALVPAGQAEMPSAQMLAESQIVSAIAKGRRDATADPRWSFRDLDRLVNTMTPGELWVVGASSGNGKTALMFSQMTAFAEAGVPVLYLPLEMEPDDMRRRWAAWELGLDMEFTAKNQWSRLPEGARDRHEQTLARQVDSLIQIPDDRQITLTNLAKWMHWGIDCFGARIVVIDHFHRIDFEDSRAKDFRVQVTKAVRDLKDLARQHQVVIVATAQLNSVNDPLDPYLPPTKQRLKESSALHEEADVVLMLSRRLSAAIGKEDLNRIRMGAASVRDFADPNVMLVTCRKHRLADSRACDRSVRLAVTDGKVGDLARSWETA